MECQEVMCDCGTSAIIAVAGKVIKTFPRYPTEIGETTCSKCGKKLVLKIVLEAKVR